MIYLDTSVVVPIYWPESLSNSVEALLKQETDPPGLSQLVEVELVSALSHRVRMGELSRDMAGSIVKHFHEHLDEGFYSLLAVKPTHYALAQDWIGHFEISLRTLDAIHLAIAASNDLCLVTADKGLVETAKQLGVTVQLLTAGNVK